MLCPSNIRCRDSNSQPLDNESPPITTRPGLPPLNLNIFRGGKTENWIRCQKDEPLVLGGSPGLVVKFVMFSTLQDIKFFCKVA